MPRGLASCLASDLSLKPVDFHHFSCPEGGWRGSSEGAARYIVGGYFLLSGSHADILLGALPPIVHIRKESDKAAMRWSLERMKEELRDPQPGGSLIAQQLAYMMLIQALRLHLADEAKGGVGWLFALADKQMSAAITSMHDDPGIAGHCRNRGSVGHVAIDLCAEIQRDGWGVADGVPDALANATGRRQAEDSRRSYLRYCLISWLRIRKRLRQSLQKGHGLFARPIQP